MALTSVFFQNVSFAVYSPCKPSVLYQALLPASRYPLSGTPSAGVAQPFCFLRDSHIRSGRDTGFTGMEASGSDDDTGFTGLSGFHLAVQPGDEKSKRDRLTSCRRRFMNPAKSWYCEKPLSARKGAGQVVRVTSWPMIICLLARARCN